MQTGLQLMNEIEDRLGRRQTKTLENPAVDADTRKMLRVLNRVLANLVALESWPMLRAEGTLLTQTPFDQGTLLDMTNGSVTVSISSFEAARAAAADPVETPLSFKDSDKTWAISFGDTYPVYRIEKIVSPSEIELNRAWIGTTVTPADADASTTPVIMAQDRYTLPEDFDSPSGKWTDFLSKYNVTATGPESFDKLRKARGTSISVDDPSHFTVWGLDPSQTYQVLHLNPWPKQQTMMEYKYNMVHPTIAVDKDLILFPKSQLSVIIEAVIYFADRDYHDDPRFQVALQEFLTQFNQAKGRGKMTEDIKRTTPKVYGRARSVRLLNGSGAIRYDYGEAFDRADMFDLP